MRNGDLFASKLLDTDRRRSAWLAAALLCALVWAQAAGAEQQYVLSIGTNGTVCNWDDGCVLGTCAVGGAACLQDQDCAGCFEVANEDLVMCDPVSLGEGATQCEWSLFFDGSVAGLTSKVFAADILSDGSIVMRVGADGSIPDISGLKRKDLARFIPKDAMGNPTPFQLPYTEGEWQLFLDGDAVKDSSDSRVWNAVEVLYPESCRDLNGDMDIEPEECDVILSIGTGANLGTPPNVIAPKNEDLIRCRPTTTPGGTIEECEYALLLDASRINAVGFPGADPSGETDSFQANLNAVEFTEYSVADLAGTLLMRVGGNPTLPSHEGERDLLKMIGAFGPTGACSTTTTTRCLTDGDCPSGETCGAFDENPSTFTATTLVFDGKLPGSRVVPDFSAGLHGETIQAFSIVPDGDGDGAPDGIDNCPNDANPGQEDTDGDGVGDLCDQCNGRDDDVCFCGDFIPDFPSESCDLGVDPPGFNGALDSPCNAMCQIEGICTSSIGNPIPEMCTVADACSGAATGEGCCGNGVREGYCNDGSGSCSESNDCRSCVFGLCADGVTACTTIADCSETCLQGDEECDDGNPLDDDSCRNDCTINDTPAPLPTVCQQLFGPNVQIAFFRPGALIDTRKVTLEGYDRWRVRGEFNLIDGVTFDPQDQQVDLVLSQESFSCDGGSADGFQCLTEADCPGGTCESDLFHVTLTPDDGDNHFIPQGTAGVRWVFKNLDGNNPGAESWRIGKLKQRNKSKRRIFNQVKFNFTGRGDKPDPNVAIPIEDLSLGGPTSPRVRATLRVGDVCTTSVLTCEVRSSGARLKCFSSGD